MKDIEIPRELLDLVHDCIKSGYDEGYKNGIADGNINDGTFAKKIQEAYENGLNDAWECAKKIVFAPSEGGLSSENLSKIFGNGNIMKKCTASEAIAKIKEYEEKQKPKFANCSILNDECAYPYITCDKCEVHCSVERAKQKLKGDKE